MLLKIFDKTYCYKKQDNTFVLEKHSKDLIKFIKKTCDKKGLKVKTSREFKIGYIEGLIDSDGYVQRNYVEITTSNPKLKNQIIEILEKFKVACTVRKYPPSGLSKKMGFRVGFSLLHGRPFSPVKWASGV